MNKKQTIRELARRTDLTYFQAQVVFETIINIWRDSLATGERLTLSEFMSIQIKPTVAKHKLTPNAPTNGYRAHVTLHPHMKAEIRRKQGLENDLA